MELVEVEVIFHIHQCHFHIKWINAPLVRAISTMVESLAQARRVHLVLPRGKYGVAYIGIRVSRDPVESRWKFGGKSVESQWKTGGNRWNMFPPPQISIENVLENI